LSNRDGDDDVYRINVDGTNPHRLTDDPADDTAPVWRP
jgi:Tol biopolymer transport system component